MPDRVRVHELTLGVKLTESDADALKSYLAAEGFPEADTLELDVLIALVLASVCRSQKMAESGDA